MVGGSLQQTIQRFSWFIEEVHDTSDRASATVTGAVCEAALREILRAKGIGVAGINFKVLIDKSAAHGLIDGDTAEALHVLRELRNEAAHNEAPFDLAVWEPKVREIVTKIDPTRSATPIDAKAEFRRFAVLAGSALRWTATARPPTFPVSLRRVSAITAPIFTPTGVLVLVLGAAVLLALYLQTEQRGTA